VSLSREGDGRPPLDPVGRGAGMEEVRVADATHLAHGTLACPGCDAPVAPPLRALAPAEPLGCGFCGRGGAVRDFLRLGAPVRPTKVTVRVRGAAVPSRRGGRLSAR
jgi:hypothetical protein